MAKASGIKVKPADVPIIMGMIGRGDRHHDIAAWFGLNQGRIKDTQDGKYGPPVAAKAENLPPKGPPGIKGRLLREAVTETIGKLKAGGPDAVKLAMKQLRQASEAYDQNER